MISNVVRHLRPGLDNGEVGPIFVHNTTQAAAVAESIEGAAVGAGHLVYLHASTGGASILVGGEALGIAASWLVNLVGPQAVVVGGTPTEAGPLTPHPRLGFVELGMSDVGPVGTIATVAGASVRYGGRGADGAAEPDR